MPSTDADLAALIGRADAVLARVEALLPPPQPDPDWKRVTAARWRKRGGRGYLQAVAHPHAIRLDDLVAIDEQKQAIDRNTRQFVAGLPANNVLLTGSRGTGKSSLIKACLNSYSARGLRLIEVDKDDLVDLPDIVDLVAGRPERFIVFCDDLSFEEGEAGYKALKVALDGSVSAQSENVLIYATSNRRHLMPRTNTEDRGLVASAEDAEEEVSVSDRFGLWIGFPPMDQATYLAAINAYAERYGLADPELDRRALQWAQLRGSRSGRVAYQFIRDLACEQGKHLPL